MAGGVVARAWVQILPEMDGIQREVESELRGVDGQSSKAGRSAGSGFASGFKAAIAAVGGLVAAAGISDLVSQSAEVQSQMSRLSASARQNGVSADSMNAAYTGLVGVLGETDRAVEASGNMFALCGDNQAQLESLTTSLAGAYSQFGDGLPIESLAEAANETARTGTVVGSMADALNWVNASTDQWSAALSGNSAAQAAFNAAVASGASKEDAFNAALAACNDEGERAQLVTSTLNALYGEAGQQYMDANADLIEYQRSQDALTGSMASLGGALMPLQTNFNNFAAGLLGGVVPALQMMASGDVAGGVQMLVQTLTEAFGQVAQALPTVVQALSGVVSGLILAIGQMFANPENVMVIVNAFVQLFSALAQALPQILAALAVAIPQIVLGLVSVLTNGECMTSIINGFVQLFLALLQALPLIIQAIVPAIPQLVMALGNALIQNGPALLSAAFQCFMALLQALVQVVPQILSALVQLIASAGAQIAGGAGQMLASAGEMFMGLVNGAVQGIEDFMGKVGEIPGKIANFFADAGSWLLDSGRAILDGLIEGITEGFEAAADAVSGGLEYIRGFLPFSPAKRGPFSGHGYTTYSGEAMMADWGRGIDAGVPAAVDYAAEAAGRVRDALAGVAGASPASRAASVEGAAGGPVVNQTFNTRVVRADEDMYAVAPVVYRNAQREARLMGAW